MQEYDPNKFTVILLPVPLEKAQKFLEKDPQSFAMACSLSMKSQAENNQILEIGNFKELGLASESRYRRCKKILEDMGFLSLITTCRQHSVEGFSNKQETIQDTIPITKKHTKKTIVKLSYNHDLMFITKTQKQPNDRPYDRPYDRPDPFFAKKIIEIWHQNSSHPFRYNLYIYKELYSRYLLSGQMPEVMNIPKKAAAPDPVASAAPSARRKEKIDAPFFCKEEGKFKNLRPAFLKTLSEVYGSKVDIESEFKKMCLWCASNEAKASKKQLWEKFIIGWLNRASDKNFNKQASSFQKQQPKDQPIDEEKVAMYKKIYGF